MAFRGVIPNPDRQLLPGMFVNVRVTVGQLNDGYLVPQVAVQTDANGTFVPVVNAEEKVEQRRVETAGTRADKWIVTSGLKDGDRVIVSGIQRAPVGAQVKIVPQEAPAEKAASADSGGAPGQH
jgi:membrane fusion protein (multidrug efflux system)